MVIDPQFEQWPPLCGGWGSWITPHEGGAWQAACWASLSSASEKCSSPLEFPWTELLKISAVLLFIPNRAGDHVCIMLPEEACFLLLSNKLSVQGSHLWCDRQNFSPLSCLMGILNHILHLLGKSLHSPLAVPVPAIKTFCTSCIKTVHYNIKICLNKPQRRLSALFSIMLASFLGAVFFPKEKL